MVTGARSAGVRPAAGERQPGTVPARAGAVADGLCVLLVQALMLQGFTGQLDVHPADEVKYQIDGERLLHGVVVGDVIHGAPVYSGAYALLQLLPRGDLLVQDLMGWVLVLAQALVFWWMLRRALPRGAALLLACCWTSTLGVLASQLRVYLFASTLTTAALAMALRGRAGTSLLLLCLACLDRREMTPWLAVLAVVLTVMRWRQPAPLRQRLVPIGFALAACGLLAMSLTSRVGRTRSWFTFRWYFAQIHGEEAGVSADADLVATPGDRLVAAHFGDARSIAGAMARDPGAVLTMVARNAAAVPGYLASGVMAPAFHLPALRWSLLGVAAALVLAGLARRRSGPRAPPLDPIARAVLATCPILPLALLPYSPRADYLLPLAAPVWLLAGRWIVRGVHAVAPPGRLGHRAARVAALAFLVLVPGPHASPPRDVLANRHALRMLADAAIAAEASLVADHATGLLTMAGRSAQGIERDRFLADAPLVERPPPGCHALVGPWDLLWPQGARFVAALADPGWQLVDVGYLCWLLRYRR